MTFAATVITLYPEMFPGPLGASVIGRGMAEGAWSLRTTQLRDFATDRHHTVDDTPSGGGAGMVLGGWVWALKRDLASRFLAVTGFGLMLSAVSASVYSTRELALPAVDLTALMAGNYLGTNIFGLALVSLLLARHTLLLRQIMLLFLRVDSRRVWPVVHTPKLVLQ